MQQIIGFIYVLLAGVCFGFLGVFGKIAFQNDLSVGELLTYRFTLAAIILWVGLFIFKKDLIRLSLRQIVISILLGAFGYALFSTLYFMSIKGISVALAALLLFTFPIFVSLGSHFILKDKMSRLQILSLVLACVGLTIVLWGPIVVHSLHAVLYALFAAVAYAIYVLVSGHLQQGVKPLSSSLYVISAAALALYLWHQPSMAKLVHLTTTQLGVVVGLAVVCTVFPLTLFLAGLQKMKSAQASIVVMIEPVVATFAAWFILHETLSVWQLIGAALVIVALFLNTQKV